LRGGGLRIDSNVECLAIALRWLAVPAQLAHGRQGGRAYVFLGPRLRGATLGLDRSALASMLARWCVGATPDANAVGPLDFGAPQIPVAGSLLREVCPDPVRP